MQTYTHYVMTALLNRLAVDAQELQRAADGAATARQIQVGPWRWPAVHSNALLLGSVLPDLPLIGLTIGCIISDLLTGKFGPPDGPNAAQSATGYLFDYRFFHDPWVKLAHNLFHAPLLIALYLAAGHWAWRRGWRWGQSLFWLAGACALHTAIDIPLHVLDGPLIFFPLDWERRFRSAVSYWDPNYFGRPFAIFEHLLLLAMLIYLAIDWRRRRQAQRAASAA